MNMLSLLLFIYYILNVFGTPDTIYTHQLRGMFENEKNRLTDTYIHMEYENIYSNIIQRAIIGETEIRFSILCVNQHYRHRDMPYLHTLISSILDDSILRKIELYKLSKEIIGFTILHKIKKTFPDANITLETDNSDANQSKCVYYKLQW